MTAVEAEPGRRRDAFVVLATGTRSALSERARERPVECVCERLLLA